MHGIEFYRFELRSDSLLLLRVYDTLPSSSSRAFTPKAFANSSPRLERSDNLGLAFQIIYNPVRVRQLGNPYRVHLISCFSDPGLSLRSNPGLKLANAFGVILLPFKLMHYLTIPASPAHGFMNFATPLMNICTASITSNIPIKRSIAITPLSFNNL